MGIANFVTANILNGIPLAIHQRKNTEVKAMLIENACDPKVDRWQRLLHWAARLNNAEITQHLIDLGWDVDGPPMSGSTPLMLAVEEKSQAAIRVLLNANANIDIADELNFSVLTILFCNGYVHEGIGRMILRHLRKLSSTSDEYTKKMIEAGCTLYHVVRYRDIELMKSMLAMGHNVNSKGKHRRRTALHAAVEIGDPRLVEWLIDNGADVNAEDVKFRTPLDFSCKDERLPIMNLLLDRGARLQVSIIERASSEAIRLLLRRGVKFEDLYCDYDRNWLHHLAKNRRPRVAEVFEDLEVKKWLDWIGKGPLYVAAWRGNVDMVKFFLARGANPNGSREYNPLVGTFGKPKSDKHLNDIAYLLLRGGANPQMCLRVNEDIFYYAKWYEWNIEKIKMVVAHIAMMKMMGKPISKCTRKRISLDAQLKMYYCSCRRVLKAKIFEDLTLLDLLKEIDGKMEVFLRNKLFVDKMRRIGCKYELQVTFMYYHQILKECIANVTYTRRLEFEAAKYLNKIFEDYHGMSPLVVQLIIAYFDKRDLELLCGL